jgi:hypothetical protein
MNNYAKLIYKNTKANKIKDIEWSPSDHKFLYFSYLIWVKRYI